MASPQPAIARLVQQVQEDLDGVVATTAAALRAQVPSYQVRDRADEEELDLVVRAYVENILEAIAGRGVSTDPATAALMERRADLGMTLADMLHSYRVGVSALWAELAARARDDEKAEQALVAATPVVFDMLDQFSLTASDMYTRRAVDSARRREQIRAAWLDTVLQVDPAAGSPFWDAAARLGLPRDGIFIVIETGSDTQEPSDLEAALRRRPAVKELWLRTGATSQTGLISFSGRTPDIDANLAPVIDQANLRGGASSPFSSISTIGHAVAEAHVARVATTADARYVRYDREPVAVLLASAPDASASLAAQTLSTVLSLPRPRRDPLLETVTTWLACGQSVNEAAALLYVHRNTVNYRLRRFQEITGRSLSDPAWNAQVLLALRSLRLQSADMPAGHAQGS